MLDYQPLHIAGGGKEFDVLQVPRYKGSTVANRRMALLEVSKVDELSHTGPCTQL